jgi:hypothetical protein
MPVVPAVPAVPVGANAPPVVPAPDVPVLVLPPALKLPDEASLVVALAGPDTASCSLQPAIKNRHNVICGTLPTPRPMSEQ